MSTRARALVALGVALLALTPTAANAARGDVATPTAEQRLVNDPNVVWMGTFDNPGDWKANFGIGQFGNSQNAYVETPSFGAHGKVLRVHTPGSPARTNKWGIDMRQDFPKMGIAPMEEAYFRYSVWFPENYDWEEGGKIPGLSGITEGDPSTSTSSGGDYNERSWSGRLYWKANAGLVSYMYVKHAGGKYISNSTGRYVGLAPRWWKDPSDTSKGYATFKKGAWNTIEIRYKLNTPGVNNGIHQGWLNGQLAIDLRDVQYRTAAHPDLKINQVLSSIFYGGPVLPYRDNDSYYDDYAISKSYMGPYDETTPAPAPDPEPAPDPAPAPPPAATDTAGPSISLVTPAVDAIVSGVVPVTPSVTDPSGVAQVRYLLDGTVKEVDTGSPSAWSWDTAGLSGYRTIAVEATDTKGNVTTLTRRVHVGPLPAPVPPPSSTTPITPTVPSGMTPPAVTLAAPTAGQTLTGSVLVAPGTVHASGIAKVSILLNGVVKRTGTSGVKWTFNTPNFKVGTYTLRIDVTARSGAKASLSRTVRVARATATSVSAAGLAVSARRAGAAVQGSVRTAAATSRVEVVLEGRRHAATRVGTRSWSFRAVTRARSAATVVRAVARDGSGHETWSLPVRVL